VKLVVNREDGSTKKKSKKFDSTSGESTKKFNLWIWSLFQKPLLKRGLNSIDFTLTKDGDAVESGSFEVNVSDGGTINCRRGWYWGSGSDCNSTTFICNQYLNDSRYCD